MIGGGLAQISGVGSETNPIMVSVEATQTEYVNTSSVTWNPVTGSGTEASPFQVSAVAVGAPLPVFVYGNTPLDLFGAPARDMGLAAYLDTTGKLRVQPTIIDSAVLLANADDLSKYPLGTSVYTLSTAQASAGGWPVPNSGTVVTWVRGDKVTAVQWYYRNGNSQATLDARWRVFSTTWQPWQRMIYTPDALADGQVPVYRTATSKFTMETLAPVADTGWLNLTLASGTGTMQYRALSGLIWLRANVTGLTSVAAGATGTIVAAANGVPAAYRPTLNYYGVANMSGTFLGHIVAQTDGVIALINNSASASTNARFLISYPLG